MTETMTAGQAAELLGVSEWTVYDLARRRELPHIRVGKRVLFRRQTLLDWLTAREEASVAAEQELTPGGIRRLK